MEYIKKYSDIDFKEMLQQKLEEFIAEYDNSFAWGRQLNLKKKIEACHTLLDLPVIIKKKKNE